MQSNTNYRVKQRYDEKRQIPMTSESYYVLDTKHLMATRLPEKKHYFCLFTLTRFILVRPVKDGNAMIVTAKLPLRVLQIRKIN